MATITPGQLVAFLPYGMASVQLDPMRNPPQQGGWSGRFMGSMLVTGGDKTASGVTKVAGVPTKRRVVILTHPPHSQVVYEGDSDAAGVFAFPKLAPGQYVVLDIGPAGEQALVHDRVAPV